MRMMRTYHPMCKVTWCGQDGERRVGRTGREWHGTACSAEPLSRTVVAIQSEKFVAQLGVWVCSCVVSIFLDSLCSTPFSCLLVL